jgi:hypothetical protein
MLKAHLAGTVNHNQRWKTAETKGGVRLARRVERQWQPHRSPFGEFPKPFRRITAGIGCDDDKLDVGPIVQLLPDLLEFRELLNAWPTPGREEINH